MMTASIKDNTGVAGFYGQMDTAISAFTTHETTTSWKFILSFIWLLSCAFGLLIGWFVYECRKALSATGFTVLGNASKLLTLTVNQLVWTKHAGMLGLMSTLGGLAFSAVFLEAERREKEREKQQALVEDQLTSMTKESM